MPAPKPSQHPPVTIKCIRPVAHDGRIYEPGDILKVPFKTAEFLTKSSPPWAEPLAAPSEK